LGGLRPQTSGPTAGIGLQADAASIAQMPLLRKVGIFSRDLNEEQIDSIASLGQIVEIPEGQKFAAAGEVGDHIYIVLRGDAQLLANSPVGELTIRTISQGESFPQPRL
jgi:CRP-like cAMP-binding protein